MSTRTRIVLAEAITLLSVVPLVVWGAVELARALGGGPKIAAAEAADAGKELFLNVGAGLSTDHMNNGTDLKIYNSTPTLQKTIGSTDAGYPKNSDDPGVSQGDVLYQWTDSTTDTYAANRVDVVSPAGVVFSQATVGFGTKASGDTWVFQYTLSISTADGDIEATGLDKWLFMLTNATVDHWNASSTKAKIYTGARALVHSEGVSSGPPWTRRTTAWNGRSRSARRRPTWTSAPTSWTSRETRSRTGPSRSAQGARGSAGRRHPPRCGCSSTDSG